MMLLSRGKITEEIIRLLSSWRHSGFHVFCGNRISPNDETAVENPVRYIIRASFSRESIQYLDQEAKVVYSSKDGKDKLVLAKAGKCLRCLRMAGCHVLPRPG